jgi:hypothetical protein
MIVRVPSRDLRDVAVVLVVEQREEIREGIAVLEAEGRQP